MSILGGLEIALNPRHSDVETLRELVIDNFAGGGGASTGIEAAIGRPVDVAINHDPQALAMHAINHPHTAHYCESVWDIKPAEVTRNQPVGLVWLSPDCFPAGSLVLTSAGYRAIETIRVGDRVLTHRGRWRAVTETSNTRRPILSIRGHGHPGLRVSPEHPFYVRAHQRDSARWESASAVGKGMYWATPCSFPFAEVPIVAGRGMVVTSSLLWLAGRYAGDGWTRLSEGRSELVITCGEKEADVLRQVLQAGWPRQGSRAVGNELAWHERSTRTAVQFSTNHRGLVEWLRQHFGHRAENKSMPAWALGMAPEFRAALLSGYLSAVGSRTQTFFEATTVSKAMAFSVKALAHSLGHTVAVYTGENSDVIEGRKVNARPYWQLRWRHAVDKAHCQTFRHAHLEWTPIRERGDPSGLETVFNIGVEEDESYVVEGIVVHNCKHFSKAKGGTPVSKKIRGLAWVALRWAATVKPRVIMLENVEEFTTWGPVVCDPATSTCRPCPKRKGQEFNSFVNALKRHGYAVEWRELRACDYGAPTIRKRLFLIARCDGQPICWPTPTHGDPKCDAVKRGVLLPWRTAAECIDWSIPCPSIFERKKPLAESTLRRIAKGVMRYVVDAADPFIVTNTSGHPGASVESPLRTITTGGHHALVVPTLVQAGHVERPGQPPHMPGLDHPLGAVVKGSKKNSLAAAFLVKNYTGVVGSDLGDPIGTVTAVDHHSLVTANLIHMGHGESCGTGARRWSHGVRDVEAPLNTITASGVPAGVVTSTLVKMNESGAAHGFDEPLRTISPSGSHGDEVRAFLIKYYGTDQDPRLTEPLHTITTKPRFGLVTVRGENYVIVDIGLRMLQPRELYLAQGFPAETIIGDDTAQGLALTKEAQVRMCGNSVSPVVAEAIVRANFQVSQQALQAA